MEQLNTHSYVSAMDEDKDFGIKKITKKRKLKKSFKYEIVQY